MKHIDIRLSRHGNLGAVLVKVVVGSAGIKLAYTGIGFITAILLAKMLAPAGYGVYSYVMALVAFLTIPSQLGIPTLATREFAIANAHKDWSHMRGFIIWAHKTIILLTAVLIITGLIVLSVWGATIDSAKLRCLWLGLLLVPIASLGALRGGMLRGLRKVILGQLPEQIVGPLIFLGLIVLLSLIDKNFASAAGVMGAQITASIIAFCCGLYLFWTHRPPELAGAEPRYKSAIWLKSCIPFGMSAAFQLINGRTDILVLGIFHTDADVGIYRVAVQMAALVIFGMQVVNLSQAPHIAHLYAKGEMHRLQKMVTRSSQGTMMVTIPVVLGMILFGETIIRRAFGSEYEAAYVPLVILCVGQLVNALLGPVGSLLNMTGHERDTTKSIFIGAVVNVILNFSLTPIWGMTGAAIATACTLIVWNVIMWRKVRKRIGIEALAFIRFHR